MTNNTVYLQIGGALELVLRPPPPDIQTIITVRYDGFQVTAKGDHMAYTLQSGYQIQVQIAYQDAAGNPAKIDGDVSWVSSDTDVATVTVDSTDSTLATIAALGPTGSAQITATADADLGTGVRELVTLLDVSVVAGEAVAGTITVVGDPQPIS